MQFFGCFPQLGHLGSPLLSLFKYVYFHAFCFLSRWNSTYDMIEVLLQMKSYVQKLKHLLPDPLSSDEWNKVNAISHVLRPCKELTVKLSRADIILTDIYISWLHCKMQLDILHKDGKQQWL